MVEWGRQGRDERAGREGRRREGRKREEGGNGTGGGKAERGCERATDKRKNGYMAE